MDRVFLTVVGLAYLALSIWCAVLPETTSQSVGFVLQPGGGQSEFLTVYGGLEFGLAVVFLWPVALRRDTSSSLLVCLIIHGGLVLFRSIGFFLYAGIGGTTYILAGVEWAIALASLMVWWRFRPTGENGPTRDIGPAGDIGPASRTRDVGEPGQPRETPRVGGAR